MALVSHKSSEIHKTSAILFKYAMARVRPAAKRRYKNVICIRLLNRIYGGKSVDDSRHKNSLYLRHVHKAKSSTIMIAVAARTETKSISALPSKL